MREGVSTYSVYYGQAFEDGGAEDGKVSSKLKVDEDRFRGEALQVGARQSGTLLYERLTAKTSTALRAQLPARLESDYIIDRFQSAINTSSNVNVISVINHVFLFFKLLQLRERGSSNRPTSQSGLAPLQNAPGFAYPRVDSAPDDG